MRTSERNQLLIHGHLGPWATPASQTSRTAANLSMSRASRLAAVEEQQSGVRVEEF